VPDPQQPILVLGTAKLTNRYATALTTFGLTTQEIPGDAVFAGLLTIARASGLLVVPNSQID
jgi:2-dehydro-3-deoxygalactonokinase